MPSHSTASMILLADDDEVVRTMGRDILHILGYEVLLAGNGEDLINVYKEHQNQVDVIILDWHMPGLTGMEILEALWAVDAQVKIIIATGLGQPREMDLINKSGHSVFILQKPYLVKDLQSEIARVLKK
jgi:two-component system, cell cycle sensor histidine kinase and response regulator CckA